MEDIRHYMVPGTCAHLIGIGGVSMSPLAEVLHRAGITVHGSDMRESDAVDHLRSLGVEVSIAAATRLYALPPCTIPIPKSLRPMRRGFLYLSAPRPGAPLCSIIKTPCASPALTAKPQPLR